MINKKSNNQQLSKGIGLIRYIQINYQLYLLIIPAIVFVFIFCYIPIYGVQIAFRDFSIRKGYWGSDWVGLEYFIRFITGSNFWVLLRNTLSISLYTLAVGFPVPIIIAFMLNELRSVKFSKTVQMIVYAPHFISIVAICGLIMLFLQRENGIINKILIDLNLQKEGKDFLADPAWFRTIYVISGVWQNAGWGTIIYLAALSTIDQQLVDSAVIDGAGRLQKIWYIDLPGILPTVIILLILNMGSLLSVGYEKILLLQNPLNMESSDVISTYVYRVGVQNAQYSFTAAIGLFNSVLNVIILVLVNKFASKLTSTSLW